MCQRSCTVSGVPMGVLLYTLLLVMGGTLSIVTSAPSNDLKEVQQVNATVLWKQNYARDLSFQSEQELFDHYSSWGDVFQTASMQLAKRFKDMLKTITGVQQVCTEKADCKGAHKACCWVPGSNYKQQCVKEVPTSSNLLYFYTMEDMGRRGMLNYIQFQISIFASFQMYLNVLVLPVGQGDCIAMYCPNGDLVMFDCGSRNRQSALTADELKGIILNKV